jgi:hypothetical protein
MQTSRSTKVASLGCFALMLNAPFILAQSPKKPDQTEKSPRVIVITPGSAKPAAVPPALDTWPLCKIDGQLPVVPDAYNRLDKLKAEELAKQIAQVPELDFDDSGEVVKKMLAEAKLTGSTDGFVGYGRIPETLSRRWQSLGLTPRTAVADAQARPAAAKVLERLSRELRLRRMVSTPDSEGRIRPAHLDSLIRPLSEAVKSANIIDCLPGLWQMLQAEDNPQRTVLVQYMGQLNDPSVSVALAQRALYDVSPEIRYLAVTELKKRPAAQYRQVLLDGFRYPWPAVAEHAAEALVEVGDKEARPALQQLLRQPNPGDPFQPQGKDKKPQVRELVRFNHLKNCLMCHSPSLAEKDPVPGRVPVAGKKLELVYYSGPRKGDDIFVRADITYIRQDFSMPQRVEDPGAWPELQRYDYLVRTRDASAEEIAAHQKQPANATYPQRDAVLWALKELEGGR